MIDDQRSQGVLRKIVIGRAVGVSDVTDDSLLRQRLFQRREALV